MSDEKRVVFDLRPPEVSTWKCERNVMGHDAADSGNGCAGCDAEHVRMMDKHIGPAWRRGPEEVSMCGADVHSIPGSYNVCRLAAGHDGDHRDGDAFWPQRRPASARPGIEEYEVEDRIIDTIARVADGERAVSHEDIQALRSMIRGLLRGPAAPEWEALAVELRTREARMSGILCDLADVPSDPLEGLRVLAAHYRATARARSAGIDVHPSHLPTFVDLQHERLDAMVPAEPAMAAAAFMREEWEFPAEALAYLLMQRDQRDDMRVKEDPK